MAERLQVASLCSPAEWSRKHKKKHRTVRIWLNWLWERMCHYALRTFWENSLTLRCDVCVRMVSGQTDRRAKKITNKHIGVVMNDAFELLLHLLLSLLRIYRTRERLYALMCWYLRMFADLMTWNGEYTCRIYTARMQLHLGSVWYPSHAIQTSCSFYLY